MATRYHCAEFDRSAVTHVVEFLIKDVPCLYGDRLPLALVSIAGQLIARKAAVTELSRAPYARVRRGYDGESGGPPFHQKEIEFVIGGDAISRCLAELNYLHSSVSSSSTFGHV